MSLSNNDKAGHTNIELKIGGLEQNHKHNTPPLNFSDNRSHQNISSYEKHQYKEQEFIAVPNPANDNVTPNIITHTSNLRKKASEDKASSSTAQLAIDQKHVADNIPNINKSPKEVVNDSRRIYINQVYKNKKKFFFPDNFVRTSKYTIIDFIPKSLLLQFKRYANIYFLIIAVLQSIPSISPMNPSTAIAPLVFVLMVSMIREGFEDYDRHQSDEKENMDKVYRLIGNEFKEDLSKNIEVGDIIRINEYSIIPADFLLLACDNLSKIAYIETANLDGEKNLKPKFCLPNTFNIYKDANTNNIRIRGKILCDRPNSDLNKFNGRLKFSIKNESSISIKQFLYKGIEFYKFRDYSQKH
jgi:magnesium-transporting ATPase (P-type)